MPQCKECGNKFPCRIQIGTRIIPVVNRTRCFECSPYGEISPSKVSETYEGVRICSLCSAEKPINEFYVTKVNETKERLTYCKPCYSAYIKNRKLKAKLKAIAYKGGACCKCGYNKTKTALEFHHRDPSTKDFAISIAATRGFNSLKSELDKCDLLCSNCHRETHDLISGVPLLSELLKMLTTEFQPNSEGDELDQPKMLKKRVSQAKLKKGEQNKCSKCGVLTKTHANRCPECYYRSAEKIKWPEDAELFKRMEKEKHEKVAIDLGVSSQAIKKRLKFRGYQVSKKRGGGETGG